MGDVGIVIAAGGRGRRMGGGVPKQFMTLAGQCIITRVVKPFASTGAVTQIVVVVPPRFIELTRRMLRRQGWKKTITVVAGGRDRQESVWNGLEAFTVKPEIVLVHDAVRPFVTKELIRRVITMTRRYRAVVVAVPVTDTIKLEGVEGFAGRTVDRSRLWSAQTPQGFQYETLVRAERAARRSGYRGTDEASLVERLRVPVRIVRGEPGNIKITTKTDMDLAYAFAKKWKRER